MDFRGGDDDAVFFHQLTLLDSKQGFSSLRPLLLSGVNYSKTQIKYCYVTNWHEVFIEDILGEVFEKRKT